MSVEITGLDAVLVEVERRLGPERMERISDAALVAASAVFKAELQRQFSTFKDTGASLEEITLTAPRNVNGVRTITVHWRGPKGRYRIIHLNEFGTVKNPNPPGKGAIARALRNAETAYRNAILTALRGAL